MQRISRAPELSATLSFVSCWITVSPGLLDHLEEAPALRAGEWPGLDHAHDVALLRLVLLIVRAQLAAAADHLLVGGVAPDHCDAHGDRLVGARRDHGALSNLPRPRFVVGCRSTGARLAALSS